MINIDELLQENDLTPIKLNLKPLYAQYILYQKDKTYVFYDPEKNRYQIRCDLAHSICVNKTWDKIDKKIITPEDYKSDKQILINMQDLLVPKDLLIKICHKFWMPPPSIALSHIFKVPEPMIQDILDRYKMPYIKNYKL